MNQLYTLVWCRVDGLFGACNSAVDAAIFSIEEARLDHGEWVIKRRQSSWVLLPQGEAHAKHCPARAQATRYLRTTSRAELVAVKLAASRAKPIDHAGDSHTWGVGQGFGAVDLPCRAVGGLLMSDSG